MTGHNFRNTNKHLSDKALDEIFKKARSNQTDATSDPVYNALMRKANGIVLKEREDKKKESGRYDNYVLKMNNRKINNYDKKRVPYQNRTTYDEDMMVNAKRNRKIFKEKEKAKKEKEKKEKEKEEKKEKEKKEKEYSSSKKSNK